MTAPLLIGLSDFGDYKHITSNLNASIKLDPYIREAQEFDLRPLMGTEFYLALCEDFEASPSLATYEDLFNGSEYTIGGVKHQHNGIKAALIYFAYARYIPGGQVNSTPFGLVQKLNQTDSQPVSDKIIARLVQQARSGAESYWSRTHKFLLDNINSYPLYRYPRKPKSGGMRFISVGGNSKTY